MIYIVEADIGILDWTGRAKRDGPIRILGYSYLSNIIDLAQY